MHPSTLLTYYYSNVKALVMKKQKSAQNWQQILRLKAGKKEGAYYHTSSASVSTEFSEEKKI